MTPKIEKLIVKYITKSATAKDFDELSEWIKKPSNKHEFKDFVQTHHAINYSMNNPDSKKAIEHLLFRIHKEKSWVYKLKTKPVFKYAAAAILVIALALTYFLKDNIFENNIEKITPIIVDNQIEPGSDKATLTLESGEIVTLVKGANYESQNAISNGEEIVYNNVNSKSFELVFNYLTVPRGGQFNIELSDGTKVWLNSESQLKFPVSFEEGEARQVELVYGEAYFDVSPSTKHKGSKFKVFNKAQEVEVLGTEFNIKAYRDESSIYTTLVEGIVAVQFGNKRQNLEPNQQSKLNLETNSLTTNVVDVYNEISWKEGIFSFDGETLKDIMKVLSRWYDMDVVFENESIANEEFIGLLRKDQEIEKIISTIKDFGIIKDYEFKGKNLVLK